MYPAAIIAATIAASVSVEITLKISANTLDKITIEPIVDRQCFTIISNACLNLLTFRLIEIIRWVENKVQPQFAYELLSRFASSLLRLPTLQTPYLLQGHQDLLLLFLAELI
jgi:hypothetical protein